jgi:hypothetical protein
MEEIKNYNSDDIERTGKVYIRKYMLGGKLYTKKAISVIDSAGKEIYITRLVDTLNYICEIPDQNEKTSIFMKDLKK